MVGSAEDFKRSFVRAYFGKTASGESREGASFFRRLKATPPAHLRRFGVEAAGGESDSVTIVATGHRSEFAYDEFGRRIQITELDKGANPGSTHDGYIMNDLGQT